MLKMYTLMSKGKGKISSLFTIIMQNDEEHVRNETGVVLL